jgi:hypothetical protein
MPSREPSRIIVLAPGRGGRQRDPSRGDIPFQRTAAMDIVEPCHVGIRIRM